MKANWTTEKPTQDGYYWRRHPDQDTMPAMLVRVSHYPGLSLEVSFHGNDMVEDLRGVPDTDEWSGPLEVPS